MLFGFTPGSCSLELSRTVLVEFPLEWMLCSGIFWLLASCSLVLFPHRHHPDWKDKCLECGFMRTSVEVCFLLRSAVVPKQIRSLFRLPETKHDVSQLQRFLAFFLLVRFGAFAW